MGQKYQLKILFLMPSTSYSIAAPLPPMIKSKLQRLCFGLPAVRWEEEGNLHLSLILIGQVEGSVLLDIKEKLAEIQLPPFSLSLDGVGCNYKRSKGIIWAGVQPSEALLKLHQSLSKALNSLPLKKEARTFSPRIVLAHYDKLNETRLCDYLQNNAGFMSESFPINSFVLLACDKTDRHTLFVVKEQFVLKE